MSNPLAIATVTESLRQVLQGVVVTSPVLNATVTALRPDATAGLPNPGVNIFLYQITPNPAWRNADLPTRTAGGQLLRRPQAAVDLHYLFTFYGDDTQLDQQRLLGIVTSTMHAQPVLSRNAIQTALTNARFLAGADLADQSELVRFVPINFSLEELSKLWSFLLKVDYALSVAYVASVVLIDTDDPIPPLPLPVLTPQLYAIPFSQPVITGIASADGPDVPIVAGSTIDVTGRNMLLAASTGQTLVAIGGVQQPALVVTATRVTVTLPPGLAAGAQTAQVIQSLMLGHPPTPHVMGFQSDVGTFVLHPVIQPVGSPPTGFAITVTPDFGSPPGNLVEIAVDPVVVSGQQALLELLQPSDPTITRLFDAGPITSATSTLTFDVQGIPSGDYLVRVRVNGAESPLEFDPSGAPVAPSLSL